MKPKLNRAAHIVPVLNQRQARALGAGSDAEQTDVSEDAALGRGVRWRAAEDFDVGVPGEMSSEGCIGPFAT